MLFVFRHALARCAILSARMNFMLTSHANTLAPRAGKPMRFTAHWKLMSWPEYTISHDEPHRPIIMDSKSVHTVTTISGASGCYQVPRTDRRAFSCSRAQVLKACWIDAAGG